MRRAARTRTSCSDWQADWAEPEVIRRCLRFCPSSHTSKIRPYTLLPKQECGMRARVGAHVLSKPSGRGVPYHARTHQLSRDATLPEAVPRGPLSGPGKPRRKQGYWLHPPTERGGHPTEELKVAGEDPAGLDGWSSIG